MTNIKISIITASYNYEGYIGDTIESVLGQTYSDWELIIVDDGSSDNSINIINGYCAKDSRIKLFTHENNLNKGLQETIRLALTKTTGDWVAFLESDDMFVSTNLEEKVEILKKYPDIKFIYNDVELFGEENSISSYSEYFKVLKKILDRKPFPRNIAKSFMGINMVPTFSVVLVNKQELINSDFNTPIDAYLDYWLWTQLAIKNNCYYIDKKLTKWRMHKESYINNFIMPDKKEAVTDFYRKRMQKFKNAGFKVNFMLRIINFLQSDYKREKFFRALTKKLLLLEDLLFS